MGKARKKKAKENEEGRVGLACLVRAASLLRCTLVLAGGGRELVVLWISQAEWELIITRVLAPLFLGSWQLTELCHPPVAATSDEDLLSKVRARDFWLQWPCTVSPSSQSKRERDIKTGCVLPAPRSRVAANLALAAGLAGSSARPSDRRVSLSTGGEGYNYVVFDAYGVLAMKEGSTRNGNCWIKLEDEWSLKVAAARPPAPPHPARPARPRRVCPIGIGVLLCMQKERRWRVHIGLHVLVAYMKLGPSGEHFGDVACC